MLNVDFLHQTIIRERRLFFYLRSEVEEKLRDEPMSQHQLEDFGGLEIDSNMNAMKARKEAENVLLELANHSG